MAGFTDERLLQWQEFFEQYREYAALLERNLVTSSPKIRNISDGRTSTKGQDEFAIALPITNQKWGLRNVNGIKDGMLIGFAKQCIVYDFEKSIAYVIPYEKIGAMKVEQSTITIELFDKQKIILNLHLNIGFQAAKGCLAALGGIGTDNAFDRMEMRDMSRESKVELDRMTNFRDGIYNFFVEAAEGHPVSKRAI